MCVHVYVYTFYVTIVWFVVSTCIIMFSSLTVVRVRFTEDDYSAREDEGPITACIIRDRPIASAFTVTVNADELSPADAESE